MSKFPLKDSIPFYGLKNITMCDCHHLFKHLVFIVYLEDNFQLFAVIKKTGTSLCAS